MSPCLFARPQAPSCVLSPRGAQVEKLEDPVLPIAEIVAKCPAQQLMAQYRIPAFADADEFLQARLADLQHHMLPIPVNAG